MLSKSVNFFVNINLLLQFTAAVFLNLIKNIHNNFHVASFLEKFEAHNAKLLFKSLNMVSTMFYVI